MPIRARRTISLYRATAIRRDIATIMRLPASTSCRFPSARRSLRPAWLGLGLEVEGRTFVEGEFLDTVCGIPDSRTEIVMLRPPDDGTRIELSNFVRPDHLPGSPAAMANELGLRNVAFEVDDLQAAVDWAASASTRAPGG